MKYRDFAKRMHALASPEVKDAFYNGCVNELAGRVLRKVKKKTPVGPGVFEVIYNDDGSVKSTNVEKEKVRPGLKKLLKAERFAGDGTPRLRKGAGALTKLRY